MADQLSKDADVQPQRDLRVLDVSHRPQQPFPVWLTTRQAWLFLGCKTLKATYQWIRHHGIVRRSNGTIARRDLERELARPRRKKQMAATSLANLRKRG